MKRMGMVVGIIPDKIAIYRSLHEAVWPEVLEQLKLANIRNYSIFLLEPENLLFGYWEYHGTNFDADMARIANDPTTLEWWKLTDHCQQRLISAKPNEQWAMMPRVFGTE